MSKSNSSGGTSILTLLGVLFITLKLTNVIDWSWWWVLLPIWGSIALGLLLILVILLSKNIIKRMYEKKEKDFEERWKK